MQNIKRKKMKSIAVVLIICFGSANVFAQVKTDAVSIFKMQLFLDKKNNDYRGMDSTVVKSDSLYKAFSNVVNLKLDTLKISGIWEFTKSALAPQYKFYRLSLSNCIYTRNLNNGEEQFYAFSSGYIDAYILAVNQKTGLVYRLKGFNGNDFLGFLLDFKAEYEESIGEKLTTKKFLKSYKVEELDFQCLYQGLYSDETDRNKYPCLKRVSDAVRIK